VFRSLRFGSLALAVALSMSGTLALGQQLYDVRHDFDLRLRGNQVVRAAWQWNLASSAQGIGFDSDTDFGSGPYNTPAADFRLISSTTSHAFGDASADFSVSATGLGFNHVEGSGTITPPSGVRASSFAMSTLALNQGTRDGAGRINWKPHWNMNTVFGAGRRGVRDPMHFTVFDIGGSNLFEETLFDLKVDLWDGGSASWENGDLAMAADDGEFRLSMEGAHITSGVGHAFLQFENGLITSADVTGVFVGLFPSIGNSSHFGAHIGDPSGNIDIGFNFGPETTEGYDFTANLGTGGYGEVLPEPASIAMLGLGLAYFAKRRKPVRLSVAKVEETLHNRP
jgi:hypothetical protein